MTEPALEVRDLVVYDGKRGRGVPAVDGGFEL